MKNSEFWSLFTQRFTPAPKSILYKVTHVCYFGNKKMFLLKHLKKQVWTFFCWKTHLIKIMVCLNWDLDKRWLSVVGKAQRSILTGFSTHVEHNALMHRIIFSVILKKPTWTFIQIMLVSRVSYITLSVQPSNKYVKINRISDLNTSTALLCRFSLRQHSSIWHPGNEHTSYLTVLERCFKWERCLPS